jgi:hypothetical protein
MSHECRFCSGSGCSTCRNTGQEGMAYQVGALLDFRSTDIEVDGLPTAHLRAKAQMDTDWETPVGVWTGQAHGSELVEIWYQGRQFIG